MAELENSLISTKPYMLRAIHEWCVDNSLTPHLLVEVNSETRVPMAYVNDGEIVLNLNHTATKDMHIDNDQITFSARFGGVSQHLFVPMNAIKGLFARENGQGVFFEIEKESNKPLENQDQKRVIKPVKIVENQLDKLEETDSKTPPNKKNHKKPALSIVK
jgi:stringent starvation protein B